MTEQATTPPSATGISRYGWYALVLMSSAQMMSMLDRQILSILANDIRTDLEIGDAEMGLLYGTVFALFYALFSLPLGRLVDGWIRTKLLAICLAGWSVFAGLSAFAQGFALLAVSRLGVGIGEASVSGPARVAHSSLDIKDFNDGEILIVPRTSADFVEAIRRSGGIITEDDSLTSHAAVIGLRLGVPVIVGVKNATEIIRDGTILTLDTRRGLVYSGALGAARNTPGLGF